MASYTAGEPGCAGSATSTECDGRPKDGAAMPAGAEKASESKAFLIKEEQNLGKSREQTERCFTGRRCSECEAVEIGRMKFGVAGPVCRSASGGLWQKMGLVRKGGRGRRCSAEIFEPLLGD